MIGAALSRIAAGGTLERAEMRDVIGAIMGGDASELEVAALLTALHTRGETLEELVGAAQALRELAVELPEAPPGAIDTCGTGGGGVGTFNISTLAALVVAAAGVPVAKHGNRAATSRCGSADLLEALGIPVDAPPPRMARAVGEVGIGFLFARTCHPAMKRVAPIRSALPIPTVFNRLGPLAHPMGVKRQLVGVAERSMLDSTLEALVELGAECAWVFHSADAKDEIALSGPTEVLRCCEGHIEAFHLEPGDYVNEAGLEALRGGDVAANVRIARAVLEGAPGAHRDAVALASGAALCVAGRAADLAEGVSEAQRLLESGAAAALLERWVAFLAEPGAAT
jgi:anthranilate phosphoribosyltransferase